MVHHFQEITHTTELGTWRLTRAQPAPDLAGVVHEYWEVEGRLSPFREAVLPNGCVEVMVNLGPPHRVVDGPGMGVWSHSWYSGLHERSIFIEALEGTHLISARLTPLGATELFGFQAPSAANSILDLATFVQADADKLRAELCAADSRDARFRILDAFVRTRRAAGEAAPAFVRDAAVAIERAHGNLRVATVHEALGVSRKHLAVSFRRFMGVSMKAYASIRRFVWALDRLQNTKLIDWCRIAAECGYSDQSHLVRDFRRIGAASPTEYLRRFSPDGDALLETHSR